MPIIGGITQCGANHEERDKAFHKFGVLLEGVWGGGKLLLCALRILDGFAGDVNKPEACYLLEALIAYALSSRFEPRQDLSPLLDASA